MSQHDVVVIGAGLFGSIIAAELRRQGASVVVLDDHRPDAGSKAAGCVIKPSWVSSMKGPQLDEALELLNTLYGVEDVDFTVRPSGLVTRAHRVEPSRILAPPDLEYTVDAIHGWGVMAGGVALEARRGIVLAGGIWTPKLALGVDVVGKYGWSWRGPLVERPEIRAWAPYRQVVSLNFADGRSWRGDGQALKDSSATEERRRQSFDRCFPDKDDSARLTFVRGARPYCDTGGAPALVERRGRLWIATGGAKNGTVGAAWAAKKIAKEML